VPLATLRDELGIARDGVTARDLLVAAERHGLAGRGIRLDVSDVALVPRASILHWQFNHFVVLDGVDRDGIRIVDPAHGPRLLSPSEFSDGFTGVALLFEPTAGFQPVVSQPTTRRHRFRRMIGEILSERAVVTRVVVMSLLLRLFALAVPLVTGLVVDKVVPRGDRHLLLVAIVAGGFLVAFNAGASVLRARLLLHLRTVLDSRMTLGFLGHLVSLPYGFFQTRSTGDLMMRVSSNATVREILTSNTLSGLLDGCFVLLYAVVIMLTSPGLGVLVLVLAGLHALIFLASRRRYRELLAADLEAQAKAQAQLVQLLGGIETLKVAGAEQQGLSRWFNLYSGQLNLAVKRGGLSATVDALRGVVEAVAPLAILGVGALSVMSGDLSLGAMLAVTALGLGLFGPLSSLVASGLQLQLLGGYLDRIEDVLETAPEQAGDTVVPAHPLEGAVSVRNLSFRYSDGAPLVVDDVSLDIPAGASVAIVGPSGSGKSTLANLLVGLYRPTSGAVYYDGRNLATLEVGSVRRQVGVVPQAPFIFGGSVRDNIALTMPEADLARVVHAARTACIDDAIQAMPMGYDTLVADNGASLSGGQRQRLAIARAVLTSPSLLMLDEATSALDGVTENRVMNHLSRLAATRIVVAHRLSTVIDADLIVVMDRGKVVEAGRHGELLARGGLYSALVGRRSERPALGVAS
jgi:ATP-binding cassette subfamily B protein